MLHFIDVLVVSSPIMAFSRFLFLIRLGGRKLGPWIIYASALCLNISINSQRILYLERLSAMTVWRVDVSLLVEDGVLML